MLEIYAFIFKLQDLFLNILTNFLVGARKVRLIDLYAHITTLIDLNIFILHKWSEA